MNFSLEMAMMAALLLGGFAALALAMRKRERLLTNLVAQMALRLDKAEQEAERQRGVMGKLFAQRERDLETKIRQTHSDLKRVEMQMRSPEREASESVELAIQLTRQGEHLDQIMRKTGLPADIIETISTLHSARPRH
jgi:hypothetical protein